MSLETSDRLASLVRHYRLSAGLSQEDLAERTGLSVRTISDFERGLRTAPRLETIRMLADGLDLPDADRASLIAAARPELKSGPLQQSIDASTPLGQPSFDLPSTTGALIGRDRERNDLVSLLSGTTTRLITLTGPGGAGKTRLALAVAREASPMFPGGVTFVALAPVRDASLVLPTIAGALGVQKSGSSPLIEHVRGFLGNRSMLLVLDNMEQVRESAPDVAALLAVCPALKIMVTSRGALRISGEQLFPVPALRVPAPAEASALAEVAAADAVALFVDRAQMAQPGFSLTQSNASAIVEICHRLDGLPLAIELAAARVPLLPPAVLLSRMERTLPLLTSGPRDLPERLQTMRAAIAWSYDLLSPEEQTAFRRLSIFSGGFTLEAAEAVMVAGSDERPDTISSAAQLDRLAALVERGLVWQTEQPDGDARFGMLETIREFGLEQLEGAGEMDSVRQAHAAWYVALAEELDIRERSAATRSLDRMERELPNFRIALVGTAGIERLHLAQALSYLWGLRGPRTEGREWLERALANAPNPPLALLSAALESLSFLEHSLGNPELGAMHLRQALTIARELGDRRGITLALSKLAEFAIDAGDDERANHILSEIDKWGTDPGDCFDHSASACVSRGILARRHGHLLQAQGYFCDAAARFGRSDDAFGLAIAREFLGLIGCDRGEHAVAAGYLRESLDDWREVGTRESLIDWLAIVATLAAAVGETSRSCRWFGAVEAQAEILGFNFPVPERAEFDRTAERVRSGPDDPYWIAGRNLPLDQATEEAACWLDAIATPEVLPVRLENRC